MRDLAWQHDAGVVDENVNRSKLGGDHLGRVAERRAIADIGGDRERTARGPGDPTARGRWLGGVPGLREVVRLLLSTPVPAK